MIRYVFNERHATLIFPSFAIVGTRLDLGSFKYFNVLGIQLVYDYYSDVLFIHHNQYQFFFVKDEHFHLVIDSSCLMSYPFTSCPVDKLFHQSHFSYPLHFSLEGFLSSLHSVGRNSKAAFSNPLFLSDPCLSMF